MNITTTTNLTSSSYYNTTDDELFVDDSFILTTTTQSLSSQSINFNIFDLTTILTALFYGSAFISGTIGNGLIIYIIINYPRMRTLSNIFLASLATADLLLVCVCIPIKFIQLITYTWTFGLFMCKAIHYVQSLSAYCSVLTLTIISVERYYAIIHPVKCRATFSMRHIRKMILLTWLLSALLASPSMGVYILVRIGDEYDMNYNYNNNNYNNNNNNENNNENENNDINDIDYQNNNYYWCVRIASDWINDYTNETFLNNNNNNNNDDEDYYYWNNYNYLNYINKKWYEARIIYEIYQIFTILILPTIIMIFTYTKICTHLWIVFHNRNAMRFGHTCHFINNNNNNNCVTTFFQQQQLKPQQSHQAQQVQKKFITKTKKLSYHHRIATSSLSSSTDSTMTTSTSVFNYTITNNNNNNNNNRSNVISSSIDEVTTTTNKQTPQTPTSASSIRLSSRHHSYCQQCLQYFKTNDEDNQTVKQVIKMLVAVVVLFVFCWAPTLIIGLLRAFNLIAETNEGILKEIITVTFLLSYLNSVINPIIYGFMSKNFRLYFRLIFIQFWSLITTGHCIDHFQQQQQHNNNKNNHQQTQNNRINFKFHKNNTSSMKIKTKQSPNKQQQQTIELDNVQIIQ